MNWSESRRRVVCSKGRRGAVQYIAGSNRCRGSSSAPGLAVASPTRRWSRMTDLGYRQPLERLLSPDDERPELAESASSRNVLWSSS
ncbi:hypothetical protein LMG28727_03506 [Paraburkholderia kirstenboschensis]|nr:hypothetical protein LMG28727_03506 [Paraburkholderia kirstenboschensis]